MTSGAARFETLNDAATDAPWIVLAHGVSQDRRLFSAQVAAFRARYRLILIDLPGHGLSTDMAGPYGVSEYADSLEGALAEVGIAQAHFWGTHLGAAAGLLLACRKPQLFSALVLEAPVFPGRPLPAVGQMLARVAETAQTEGIATARRLWWDEGGWFAVMRARPETCRAEEQQAIIADFQGAPWLDSGLASRPLAPIDGALAQLNTQVLMMNGEHDMADFVQAADALEALLPNCRRWRVPEAGGFPLWEFPARVNEKVARFLEEN
ncbi:MAG: alpha/beta hydrolase [Pseudomonadota bacterium]